MKYKVGDKVRVRKDLKLGVNYGNYIFNGDMEGFKGKTFTIQKIGSDYYRLEETSFFWTDEMFEPVITNWDKVKEETKIEDVDGLSSALCKAIHRIKKEDNCDKRDCIECKKWLAQPYKESILDEAEKKYLSAVIRPFRNEVVFVNKKESGRHPDKEFIKIKVKDDSAFLPVFDKDTMYKGMELNKEYSLDDLEI